MFKQHSSSSATDWPLWFCFWLMAVAPFLSLYRVGPLSSFFLEAGALLAALVLVLLSAFYGRLNVRLPAAAHQRLAAPASNKRITASAK